MILKSDQLEHVTSECQLLETCNHAFVLKLVAAYQDAEALYMALELVLGGELYNLLRSSGKFPAEQARFYTSCVAAAIGYLNTMNIVYRDIKPENLLLDKEGYVKVVDLGFAKVVDYRAYTFCGTPEYAFWRARQPRRSRRSPGLLAPSSPRLLLAASSPLPPLT